MAKYVAGLHNICADETLGWWSPFSLRRGLTLDISAYLYFQFYQKVFYYDVEESFPNSKKLSIGLDLQRMLVIY